MSAIYEKILAWCRENENVRAAILTSSRAREDGSVDILSDYDLELYVRKLSPFTRAEKGDEWLEAAGPVLVRWPLRPACTGAEGWITRLTQYEEGTRIDFQITDRPPLYHDSFDAGYRVEIDKDNQCPVLPPARKKNLCISKPTKSEFEDRLNSFFWDILYLAKALRRDELYWARYMDGLIHDSCLRPLIEWHVGLAHDWRAGTNKGGRWFKKFLSPEEWSLVEATFAGSDTGESVKAMNASVDLVSRLGKNLARELHYPYPQDQEREIRAYLKKIGNLPSLIL